MFKLLLRPLLASSDYKIHFDTHVKVQTVRYVYIAILKGGPHLFLWVYAVHFLVYVFPCLLPGVALTHF